MAPTEEGQQSGLPSCHQFGPSLALVAQGRGVLQSALSPHSDLIHISDWVLGQGRKWAYPEEMNSRDFSVLRCSVE